MALPRNRGNSKVSDRRQLEDRLRFNFEFIINKYDKPFEGSPIIDLNQMSVSQPESLDAFQNFGWSSLATDLIQGKQRKGGVSGDSALGSTMSPSRSSSSNPGKGHGEDFSQAACDFTHEESDALGAFIRYRHNSLMDEPEIAGRISADEREDFESSGDDHLGSVYSGPTAGPGYRNQLDQESRAASSTAGDAANSNQDLDTTSQSENANSQGIPEFVERDVRSTREKVTSWLSDDVFRTGSQGGGVDAPHDGGKLEESTTAQGDTSQQSGLEDVSSTSGGEGEDFLQSRSTTSLLEIKERFVRRVKSILVEGNNETDDVTSSADEAVDHAPGILVPKGVSETSTRVANVNSNDYLEKSFGRPVGNTSSRSLFVEGPSDRRSIQLGKMVLESRNEAANVHCMGDESTILAGHFDDTLPQSSPKKEKSVDSYSKEMAKGSFELTHSQGGQMEWSAIPERTDSPKIKQGISIPNIESTKKTIADSASQHSRAAARPPHMTAATSGGYQSPVKTTHTDDWFRHKLATLKAEPDSDVKASKSILNEIVHFFQSPLPEMLSRPMPTLSPRGSLRTPRGKRVMRSPYQTTPSMRARCTDDKVNQAMGLRTPHPVTPEQSATKSPQNQVMKPYAGEPGTQLVDSIRSGKKVNHTFEESRTRYRDTSSSPEEDVVCLIDSSNSSPPTKTQKSSSNTPDQPDDTRIPQSQVSSKKLLQAPKTPSINLPFSHMALNSDQKTSSRVRRERLKKENKRNKCLNFGHVDEDLQMSRERRSRDLDLLMLMNSDEEDQELTDVPQKAALLDGQFQNRDKCCDRNTGEESVRPGAKQQPNKHYDRNRYILPLKSSQDGSDKPGKGLSSCQKMSAGRLYKGDVEKINHPRNERMQIMQDTDNEITGKPAVQPKKWICTENLKGDVGRGDNNVSADRRHRSDGLPDFEQTYVVSKASKGGCVPKKQPWASLMKMKHLEVQTCGTEEKSGLSKSPSQLKSMRPEKTRSTQSPRLLGKTGSGHPLHSAPQHKIVHNVEQCRGAVLSSGGHKRAVQLRGLDQRGCPGSVDVSFLSSTRIEEIDHAVEDDRTDNPEDSHDGDSLIIDSEDLMQPDALKPRELCSTGDQTRRSVASACSLHQERGRMVQATKKPGGAPVTKRETPSKRRRQGSDRTNSLESPAKKRTPVVRAPSHTTPRKHTTGKSLPRPDSWCGVDPGRVGEEGKGWGDRGRDRHRNRGQKDPRRKGWSAMVSDDSLESDGLDDCDRGHRKGERNAIGEHQQGEREEDVYEFLDSNRPGSGDRTKNTKNTSSLLSLSASVCDGPGRCTKTICFKCVMNES